MEKVFITETNPNHHISEKQKPTSIKSRNLQSPSELSCVVEYQRGMATESSRSSGSSADSYIGSLISLTSKSEIRYEGILYTINTEESSIGLSNVRSFGTEGRKKDGPQVMPSDKVYEYILFRGSDIKDLQVKSSPPVRPTQSINSDPAIIQSHYPVSASMSSSSSATANNSLPGPSTHSSQLGDPGSTFQGGLPLYQPGANLGSWGPSPPPPNTNNGGVAMPMYWPGFYAPPNGLPQLHQQSLPPPPQGLAMLPQLLQPVQYSSLKASVPSGAPNVPAPTFPEYTSPSLPASASSTNLMSNSLLGSNPPSSIPSVFATESLPTSMHSKASNPAVPTPPSGSLQPQPTLSTAAATDVNFTIPSISNKPSVLSGAKFPYQNMSQPISSAAGAPLIPTESPTPSLVTPGQLLQPGPAAIVSAQSSQAVHKDVEVVQVSPSLSSAPPVPVLVPTEVQPPVLPIPPQAHAAPKPNGAAYQNRQTHSYRERERGRGFGGSRPVMKFNEEFDFSAMNEKFNKDEVWGTLGRSNKSGSKEKDGNSSDDEESEYENDPSLPKIDVKPVYSKDDFFDTLSCNSLDRQSNNGKTRFSEQMKLDTETFGEFSRYRGGGRGGRGPYRGGRSRGGGGYHGRGGYGYGYGYVGRGRGVRNPNPTHDH